MRSSRRVGKTVALIAVTALLAVACGDGGGEPAAGADPEDAGGEAQPADDVEGEDISLTLGSGHPAGGAITYTNYLESWFVPELTRRVNEETPHTLEITEAYGGSIAPLAEVLGATSSGLLDIGAIIYPFEPSTLFLHNLEMKTPFSSPDPVVAIQAMRQVFDEVPYMADMLAEEHNQKVLSLWTTGSYHLVTTFEWDSIDDLAGHTLTAAGPNLPWITNVGVNPVQGNLNEWYTSLQTGVVDGAVMFPEATAGFLLHEVAQYYTEVGFGASPQGAITINLDVWNSLPSDVQEIILELSEEYEATVAHEVVREGEEAYETMRADGATIRSLSDEERAEWANLLPNLPNEAAQEANEMGLPGTEAFRIYIEAQKELGYEFPREWTIDD